MYSNAIISEDELYRYYLIRRWSDGHIVFWIMLNPSTADATQNDPTIRKCIGFTERWSTNTHKYGAIVVANLFALRATNPKQLQAVTAPIGPKNMSHIKHVVGEVTDNDILVAAWGRNGSLWGVGDRVAHLLPSNAMCLGFTKNHQPKHPLMLSYSTPLEPLR